LVGRRHRDDRGASALEWAVISAILVTAAVIIGGVIYNVVQDKSNQIESCGALGADAQSCTQP
jgi:Flp pilus assembly pilin Flp